MNIEAVSQRALELHEKASMPLSEALALAMREAAPGPIWPIARLFIDSGGNVCGDSHLYAPGLPEGEHDVYPLPVDANAAPFWCEQTETWLYKDETRKAFKNRPLDPQPPKPPQRFMVSSIKHQAGIVSLVTLNAEDVLPPLESGQEVTLMPAHGVGVALKVKENDRG